ncbi:hypothetical protein IW262DRAFT_1459438 [Armillaria fumosa]|nr:hypothetical protein IW262DRAFT_1459438 [Armillaria fumosa]
MSSIRIILATKWIPEEGDLPLVVYLCYDYLTLTNRLVREENVVVARGCRLTCLSSHQHLKFLTVLAMVSDLIDSSLVGYPLDGLFFGGSTAPEIPSSRAREIFPTAELSQGNGLTESNSISVAIAGEDYMTRHGSTFVFARLIFFGDTYGVLLATFPPLLTKSPLSIMEPRRQFGEVLLRGASIMKWYWRDPGQPTNSSVQNNLDLFFFVFIAATNTVLTTDSSISIENALYNDSRLAEVAAIGLLADTRLGELVAAVVSVKPAFRRNVTENLVLALVQKTFVPLFSLQRAGTCLNILQLTEICHPSNGSRTGHTLREKIRLEHIRLDFFILIIVYLSITALTPSGKIVKGNICTLPQREWEKRNGFTSCAQSRLGSFPCIRIAGLDSCLIYG